MFDLLSTQFPSGGGIAGAVYSVLGWLSSAMPYGLAIIVFTLLLRLMMTPIDFGTKYFTKKNAISMAKLKPEQDAIMQTYADDPVAMQRARTELFKKHGAGMGGFCLFTILNLLVMIFVFFAVLGALNGISNYNINYQFTRLETIHAHHMQYNNGALDDAPLLDASGNLVLDEDGEVVYVTFQYAINREFEATTTSFLWVSNIWQPDTPWARQTLTWNQFVSRTSGVQNSVIPPRDLPVDERNEELERLEKIYNEIFNPKSGVEVAGRAGNGFLFLVLLAGVTMFFSMMLNGKLMKSAKTANEPVKKEEEVGYSIRKIKDSSGSGVERLPQIDPQASMKIMKFILPVIMIVFTLLNTAALAVYIIAGSLVMLGLSFVMNFAVEKLIKFQEKRKKSRKDIQQDGNVITINPHSKYFRSKKNS